MYIDINTIITTIVTTICTALVAWLIAQLTSYLKAKSEKEKAEKKLKMIDHYTKIANDTIIQLVDYLNNTVVNELKTASEDGQLTEEEAVQIKTVCKSKLYGVLSDEALEAMKNTYGNLNSIFDVWIENAVASAKASGTGIDKTTAMGIAKQNSITHDQRTEIKDRLSDRLELIVDNTSTS